MSPNATVRFTSRWPYNLGSLAVARLSGSKVLSHTMIVINGVAYEASMQHGCRDVPVAEAMQGVKQYQDMPVFVPDLKAAIAWGELQSGKGYDFAGAFGIPLLMSDDWEDESRWWCSEHSLKMLGAGGLWLLDPAEHARVRPNDLHILNYPKSALIRC
jgi:hypothetical protein